MTPPVKSQNTYIQHPAGDSRDNGTRLLRLYVGYRLLLSVLFFSLVQLQWAPNYLGSDDHQLFSLTIFLYTAINILTPVAFYFIEDNTLSFNVWQRYDIPTDIPIVLLDKPDHR